MLSDSNTALVDLSIDFSDAQKRGGRRPERSAPAAFVDFMQSPPIATLERLSLCNIPTDFSGPLLAQLRRAPLDETGEQEFPFLPKLGRLEMQKESRYSVQAMQEVKRRRPQLSISESLEPEKKEQKVPQRKALKTKKRKRKRKVESSDEDDDDDEDTESSSESSSSSDD